MTSKRLRAPWTVNAIVVLSAAPALAALVIAPLIWTDMLGDDGDPLLAVLVVLAGCIPAVAGWTLRRGHQLAWVALVVVAAAIAVVYFPTWGIVLPTVTLILLFAPETRHHVRTSGSPLGTVVTEGTAAAGNNRTVEEQ